MRNDFAESESSHRSVLDAPPMITVRIPGRWSNPDELVSRLPKGYALTAERLSLPDGTSIEFCPLAADEQFAGLFAAGCHHPPSPRDRRTIQNYAVNACLSGPGGSFEAARRMMLAAAAILRAGGAGVFVDNSGIAHGSDDWLKLAADSQPLGGGPYWAFVNTYGSDDSIYSLGMHALGHRDAILPRTGNEELDYRRLHEFLGYTYASGAAIVDGDILGDQLSLDADDITLYRLCMEPADPLTHPGHAMHNPYGRWRLSPVQDQANRRDPC